MSTGHMVEVKLNTTYVGVGGQASIGPQHPILYYVHKRPHCDDFLRRVSPLLLGVLAILVGENGVNCDYVHLGLQVVQLGGLYSFRTRIC